jgi:hypothetical protein
MKVFEWPRELLTLQAWAGLPEISEFHLEVLEGVLSVAPRPPAAVIHENPARVDVADVLLAIEHYWIVDPGPPLRLITYRLVEGDYKLCSGPDVEIEG